MLVLETGRFIRSIATAQLAFSPSIIYSSSLQVRMIFKACTKQTRAPEKPRCYPSGVLVQDRCAAVLLFPVRSSSDPTLFAGLVACKKRHLVYAYRSPGIDVACSRQNRGRPRSLRDHPGWLIVVSVVPASLPLALADGPSALSADITVDERLPSTSVAAVTLRHAPKWALVGDQAVQS